MAFNSYGFQLSHILLCINNNCYSLNMALRSPRYLLIRLFGFTCFCDTTNAIMLKGYLLIIGNFGFGINNSLNTGLECNLNKSSNQECLILL